MAVRIKIVPNKEPNADGKWIVVKAHLPVDISFGRACHNLQHHVPNGYHIVAYLREDKIPSPG